jgi:hypothetical protein
MEGLEDYPRSCQKFDNLFPGQDRTFSLAITKGAIYCKLNGKAVIQEGQAFFADGRTIRCPEKQSDDA